MVPFLYELELGDYQIKTFVFLVESCAGSLLGLPPRCVFIVFGSSDNSSLTIPVWQFQRLSQTPIADLCFVFFVWTIERSAFGGLIRLCKSPGVLGSWVSCAPKASNQRHGLPVQGQVDVDVFFLLFSLFVFFRCTRFHPWHVNLACSIGRAECSLRAVRPGLEGAGGPLEGQRQPCVGVMMGSHGNGEIILG